MAITYGATFNKSWGSGVIEVTPPAGEIWEIQAMAMSNANVVMWGDTQAANLSAVTTVGLVTPMCLAGGVNRLRFTITPSSPASMNTHYKRFTFSDLPMQSIALGPIAATSGTADLRPPAGKVWVVKFMAATTGMSVLMTNGTNTTSRPLATTQTVGALVKFALSNTIWGRITNTAGTVQYAAVTYLEVDATMLPVQNAVITGTSGTYTDFKPPAGQIWAVFAATQNIATVNASGTILGIGTGASPKMTLQVDNNIWIALYNDGTYGGISMAQIQ